MVSRVPIQGRDYLWVDSSRALQELCGMLQASEWVCLDTEFVRERTFYPVPGLLQIATPKILGCVDLVALPNPEPLLEWIYQPEVLKVFHAAVQDLEIFYQIRGAVPRPVFDTQIAATLLGFPDQISYAALVKALLGKEIDKAHTRTDWTRRPLSDAQIAYAVEDVTYLCDLYLALSKRLHAAGRWDWLEEDFRALVDEERYRYQPARAWRRIGAAKSMGEVALAIVQTLAQWRESKALKLNLPRTWILKDKAIVEMAKRKPRNPQELAAIPDLPAKTIQKRGDELLRLIQDAVLLEPLIASDMESPRGLTDPQQALLKKLQTQVKQAARQEGLEPAILASNRVLRRIAKGEPVASVLSGWRYRMMGPLLEEVTGRC